MELFVSGFNAWSQLDFGTPLRNDADDINSFVKVLEGDSIDRPLGRLTHTLVRRNGRIIKAGIGFDNADGLEFAHSCAVTATGEIIAVRNDHTDAYACILVVYESFDAWKQQKEGRSWPCRTSVKKVAAFDVGFLILYEDGTVATTGDARFEDCLGRDVTEDQYAAVFSPTSSYQDLANPPTRPASHPAPVPDLNNLDDPVTHIAAGGYTLAALTRSGGIYTWGRSSAGTHRRQQAFSTLSGIANYVEVDGGKDVRDVALGESHAIALTTDGCVYIIGENNNGQLGLADRAGQRVEEWTKVDFDTPSGYVAVGVAAGPRSSFILTSKETR